MNYCGLLTIQSFSNSCCSELGVSIFSLFFMGSKLELQIDFPNQLIVSDS